MELSKKKRIQSKNEILIKTISIEQNKRRTFVLKLLIFTNFCITKGISQAIEIFLGVFKDLVNLQT